AICSAGAQAKVENKVPASKIQNNTLCSRIAAFIGAKEVELEVNASHTVTGALHCTRRTIRSPFRPRSTMRWDSRKALGLAIARCGSLTPFMEWQENSRRVASQKVMHRSRSQSYLARAPVRLLKGKRSRLC